MLTVGLLASMLLTQAPEKPWHPEFKAELETYLAIRFMKLPQGDKVASCMTDELEKRLSQEEMTEIAEGLPSQLPAHFLRWCACEKLKVPEALAEKNFCRPEGAEDI